MYLHWLLTQKCSVVFHFIRVLACLFVWNTDEQNELHAIRQQQQRVKRKILNKVYT